MNSGNAHTDRRHVDEVQLDPVIDAVAREMTEFEPSAALRPRVLEDIEQGRDRHAPAVSRWAWAGAAATLVLASAAAVWFARPALIPETADRTVAATPATSAQMSAAAQPQLAAGAPVARPDLAPPGASPAAARATRLGARGVAGETSFLPALAAIEPLQVSTVEPDPLQISAVEVSPFPAMPSIDIPSLDPGSNDIQPAELKKEK